MKWICIVVLVAAGFCCALQADLIEVGRLEYRQATVLSVEKNVIIFEAMGQIIEKKLPNVTRIYLSDDPDFSEAEKYRAEGEETKSKRAYQNAESLYLQAQKNATQDWHMHLIEYRLSEVRAKINPPQVELPDQDQPDSDAWMTDPKVLGENLPEPPQDPQEEKDKWDLLTDWQKRVEQGKYRRGYMLWQNSLAKYKYKKVSWVLQISGIQMDEKTRGFIVEVDPVENVYMVVQFNFSAQKMLMDFAPEDWVTVEATIIDIYLGEKLDNDKSPAPSRRTRPTQQPARQPSRTPAMPPDMMMDPGMMLPGAPGIAAPPRATPSRASRTDLSAYTTRQGQQAEEDLIPVTVILRGQSLTKSEPPKWYTDLQKQLEEEKLRQFDRIQAAVPGRTAPGAVVPQGPEVEPNLLKLPENRIVYILDNNLSAEKDFAIIRQAVNGSLAAMETSQQYSLLYAVNKQQLAPTTGAMDPGMMPGMTPEMMANMPPDMMMPGMMGPGMMPGMMGVPTGTFQQAAKRTIQASIRQLAMLAADANSKPEYLLLQAVNMHLNQAAPPARRSRDRGTNDTDQSKAVCVTLPASAVMNPKILNYATKRNNQREITFHIMLCGTRDQAIEQAYDELITANGGSIRNIDTDGNVTVVKVAEPPAPPELPVNFSLFSNGFTADNVVYVIDIYQGAQPYLEQVKQEVINSLQSLKPEQWFAVIAPKGFAPMDPSMMGPGMMPPGAPGGPMGPDMMPGMMEMSVMLQASEANKKAEIEKIQKLQAAGTGDITSSLAQAISLFNGTGTSRGRSQSPQPQVPSLAGQSNMIALISNETIASQRGAYRAVGSANRELQIPIHAFLLGGQPPTGNIRELQRIVDACDGSIIQVK